MQKLYETRHNVCKNREAPFPTFTAKKLDKFPPTFAEGNSKPTDKLPVTTTITIPLNGAKADKNLELHKAVTFKEPEVLNGEEINFTPQLLYLPLRLEPISPTSHREITEQPTLQLYALIDTGCSKTAISKKCFDTFNTQLGQQLPFTEIINLKLVGCTGSEQQIHGATTLKFVVDEKRNIFFNATIIIVENLALPLIIGQDIIGSNFVVAITKSSIHFQGDEEEDIIIPLTTQQFPPVQCKSLNACVIPPHTPYLIACTTTHPEILDTNISFSLQTGPIEHLTSLDMLYNATDNPFHVAVYNNNNADIEINTSDVLFDLELIPHNTVQINWLCLKEETTNDVSCLIETSTHNPNCKQKTSINKSCSIETSNKHSTSIEKQGHQKHQTIPSYNSNMNYIHEKIHQDKAFTEKDVLKETAHLKKENYFQPSISQIITEKSSITEAQLEDDRPITDEQFLQQFNINHLPDHYKQKAFDIFLRNKNAFSLHKYDIGHTSLVKMKIELKNNEPKMQKYHPIPLNAREQVKEILDQLLKYGIIRECHEPSPYCSNILVIKKKDGKTVRLLFDGRLLNYDTKRLPMALISKPEILSHLVGKTWLSSLDFADAFYNIELDKESQPLTAFYSHTHGLRMCYERLPQGLSNSPMYLKLVLDKVFANMTSHVLFYADDLLIATDGSLEHHFDIVNEVLERLVQSGLKLRPQKLFLAQEHIEFLGMIFQKGKVSIPEKKLEAFKQLPSPNTPKKAKSVISCLSYYRHFCPKFAELSHEVHELGQLHPKQFKWTEELETKFRTLIDQIIKNASIYLPDPKKPYYVQTDASNFCAAGRVFQKDDNNNNNEMLIAAVSRTFTSTERHYSIVKKEILALLYTLKTMDFFLRFADKLIILVDAKSIIYLRLAKDSSGILLRFSLELSKYNAEMHHIPGTENIVSDVLSRHHKDIDDITEEMISKQTISEKDTLKIISQLTIPPRTQFTKEELLNLITGPSPLDTLASKKISKTKSGKRQIKNIPITLGNKKVNLPRTTNYRPGMMLPINVLTETTTTTQKASNSSKNILSPRTTHMQEKEKDQNLAKTTISTNDQISQEKSQDFQTIKTLTNTITNGYLSVQDFKQAQHSDQFCVEIIQNIKKYPKYYLTEGLLFHKDKIVLPSNLIETVIQTRHFTIFGSHQSNTKIKRELMRYFKLPIEIDAQLKHITRTCYLCQLYSTTSEQHQVQKLPDVTTPRLSWSIDLVTDVPTSNLGNTQILVCVDDFSSFVVAIPIVSATSANLIHALKTHIFAPFGIPKIIRSDEQASIYNSNEFYEFLTNLDIQLTATAVASPFSNARAESQIKNIKHLMRKFLFQQHNLQDWDKEISILTSVHNNTTGIYSYSPEEIMFGNKLPSPIDLLSFTTPTTDVQDYMTYILQNSQKLQKHAREIMDKKKKSNQTFKNKNRQLKKFELGSLVLQKQLQVSTGSSSKWKPNFKGPYTIIKLNDDNCTAIIEHLYDNSLVKAHFTNLQLLEWNPDTLRFSENFDQLIRNESKPTTSEHIKHTIQPGRTNTLRQFEPTPSTSKSDVQPQHSETEISSKIPKNKEKSAQGTTISFDQSPQQSEKEISSKIPKNKEKSAQGTTISYEQTPQCTEDRESNQLHLRRTSRKPTPRVRLDL